ncbi:hypothetical protein AB1L30_24965 [Bremerella sp. JC817]|uniref:hypothetical protein n=1 Tax=Bremerella sp. JC817 TaxID=3231756 RepID=UPI00345B0AE2
MPQPYDASLITEGTVNEENMNLIQAVTQDAAEYLDLSLEEDTPDAIIAKVNETIRDIKLDRGNPFPEGEDIEILLGCLWASQLIKAMDFAWVEIDFNDEADTKAIGLVSPTRNIAIYPFSFVHSCLTAGVICTIALSYNMLKENGVESYYEPKQYGDLMADVHHIVPPEA